MYLTTFLVCIATVCLASPTGKIRPSPERDHSEYAILRKVLDEIPSLDHRLRHESVHKSRSLPPDVAIPMWFGRNSPWIHVYLGSPPSAFQ